MTRRLRTPLRLMALLFALALVAAACGDDGGGDTTAAPTEAPTTTADAGGGGEDPTTTTAAPATEAPMLTVSADCPIDAPMDAVTLNMIGWTFPIMDFYADELEKCNGENMEVNTQLLASADAQDQMRLDLSAGGTSAFEIMHGANGQIVEFGSEGWLLPLNDLVEKYWDEYDLADIPQTAWDGATFEGNIYGIPVVANTLHLQYRLDLFDQYGIAIPETYDDVIAMCSTLADEASIDLPFTINVHAGWAWEIEFLHFFRSFGGEGYVNADNTPAVNSPEGVAAVNKMKEVIDGCMGSAGITYSLDDTQLGLQTGGLAAANLWASRAASMDDPEVSDFVDGIGFAPAPRPNPDGARGGSAWNDFLMIPATADVDAEYIFQVIMQAADLESQRAASEFGITTRNAVAAEGLGARYLPAASTSVADGVGIYVANPAVALMRTALGNYLPLVGTGDMTAEEALQAAADEYTTEAQAQGFLP